MLSSRNSAICSIKDTHGTTLVQKVVQELVQGIHSHLLSKGRSLFVLGVEELGRLVCILL